MSIYDLAGRFRIGTRIWAGFLSVLLLLSAVAGSGYYGLGVLGDHADDLLENSQETISFVTLDGDFQEFRYRFAEYAIAGLADKGEKLTELRKLVNTDYADYLKNPKLVAREKATVGNIVKELAVFEGLIDKAVEQRKTLGFGSGDSLPKLDTALLDAVEKQEEVIASLNDAYAEENKKELNVAMEEADHAESETKTTMLIVAGLGLVAGIFFAFFTNITISNPVRAMTKVMVRLRNGERQIAIPFTSLRDEVGEMAETVEVFKQNLIEVENLQVQQEGMKRRAESDKKQALNQLADSFELSVKSTVESVAANATQMQSLATFLNAAAERTSHQSASVAAASNQATSNVQTVAAAAEELTASIREIGRQMERAGQVSRDASGEAKDADVTMKGLAERSAKIGEVVSLITDIAAQTNLLALNATIEAARAGEAGKGFAVVANEVKSLANQTAKATEDISLHINSVQGAADDAVTAIGLIVGRVEELNQIASAIASAVEEQTAATSEIARNVQQAAQGTHEVSSNISGVTEVAKETGDGAQQVLSSAHQLTREAETLQSQVKSFMATVRSA